MRGLLLVVVALIRLGTGSRLGGKSFLGRHAVRILIIIVGSSIPPFLVSISLGRTTVLAAFGCHFGGKDRTHTIIHAGAIELTDQCPSVLGHIAEGGNRFGPSGPLRVGLKGLKSRRTFLVLATASKASRCHSLGRLAGFFQIHSTIVDGRDLLLELYVLLFGLAKLFLPFL